MTIKDPFHNLILDEEELQIDADIVKWLYSPVSPEEQEKIFNQLKQASKNRQTKKLISIRLDERTIHIFKAEALRTGIPYQTLIASRLAADAHAMRA